MNNQESQKERAVFRRQTPPRVPTMSNNDAAYSQDYITLQKRLDIAKDIINKRNKLIQHQFTALIIMSVLLVFMFLFALSVQAQASQDNAAIAHTMMDRTLYGPTAADLNNGGM